jgi:hypothetical protein
MSWFRLRLTRQKMNQGVVSSQGEVLTMERLFPKLCQVDFEPENRGHASKPNTVIEKWG